MSGWEDGWMEQRAITSTEFKEMLYILSIEI